MINRDCLICHGLGRVCRNHPLRAWSKLGCQCGESEPCVCQGEAAALDEEWQDYGFIAERSKQ